jgi:hypothetical protein
MRERLMRRHRRMRAAQSGATPVIGDTLPLVLVIDSIGKPALTEWCPYALRGFRWRHERPLSAGARARQGAERFHHENRYPVLVK